MASTLRPAVGHLSLWSPRQRALVGLLLAVVAVAAVWRFATERTPQLVIHRVLPADVRLPGTAPPIAWPREGQAAVEVQGVGSFGTSGEQVPVPIASVAKVMTAYLTLRGHPLARGQQGFVITITPADVEDEQRRAGLNQSVVAVRAGERISEREALQALLLPSANNIAELLAVHDSGTTSKFVALMNSTAKRLGMSSTTYTDPSGFDDDTVSTAADQLKLASAAMRDPAFAAIVDQPTAELPLVGRVANFDGLVGQDGYVGVKTGSDRAAGGCFVFARHVKVDGRRLTVLGVVLGQREGALIESALASAERLGDSAAGALGVETALPAGTRVLRASSSDGRGASAATAQPLQVIGWGGLVLPVELLVGSPRTRLAAGEAVATVTVRGGSYSRAAALASRAVGDPSIGWRLRHLL